MEYARKKSIGEDDTEGIPPDYGFMLLKHFAFEIVRFQKRRAVISPEKRVFQAHSARASAPAAAGAVAVFNSKPL